MSSKRRIRRNQCGSKHRYDNEQAARRAIFTLAHSAGPIGFMKPYKCSYCGNFHIGHAVKP